MKTIILYLIAAVLWQAGAIAQTREISGRVVDEQGHPVAYANIRLENSLEGTSSDRDGLFRFSSDARGEGCLIVSMIGYQEVRLQADISAMQELQILLREIAVDLEEVVVHAGSFILRGTSSVERKSAVDVATTAGSEGDLFKAITLLPGAQATGTDGRLLIRGGESSESQTYIDDMHLLSPYGATFPNQQARSRYSPFFFSGVNFSMGGFSPEYSQSLSSVLPLYTRDEAKESKTGISMMNVSVGGGGTQAWDKASLSFNGEYSNLDSYIRLFYPEQVELWNKPFHSWAFQKQFRYSPYDQTHFKTFFTFDHSAFNRTEQPAFGESREMDFNEDNLYLNSTYRTRTISGMNWFAGAAFGSNKRKIHGAQYLDDKLRERESEIHLKVKAGKRISRLFKMDMGVESFVKQYRMNYDRVTPLSSRLDYHISGLYFSGDFNLLENLLLNTSLRGEYTSLNGDMALLPRLALSYKFHDIIFSGVAGRYQQMSNKDYLIRNKALSNERNLQYLLGIYTQKEEKIFRAEAYWKDYERLPLLDSQLGYTSEGEGYSRGVDLFYNDRMFLKHWDYMVAYTFNDSQRRYLNYPTPVQPPYVTRHNASVSIRYSNFDQLRSMISITQRYASGRPYHDPNGDGFMSGRTPQLHTTDVSWTILAHKKLIIYLSASNIFGRKNIYGYAYNSQPGNDGKYERKPIMLEQPQNFYVGFFLTLGKNVAYEATHF